MPKWFMFFGEEGENALKKLGFTFPSRVASGEPWLGIAVTGHRVIAEALATGRLGQHPPGALDFAVRVPKVCREGRRCDWYEEEKMQTQAKFCELYEGYGDLCSCHDPFTADVRSKQTPSLFTVRGASETGVVVVVDGVHAETLALAEVLGVEAVVHTPVGSRNERTNANVRFALYTVFAQFPDVDKAILLEDDLLLAPDVLSSLSPSLHSPFASPTISAFLYPPFLSFLFSLFISFSPLALHFPNYFILLFILHFPFLPLYLSLPTPLSSPPTISASSLSSISPSSSLTPSPHSPFATPTISTYTVPHFSPFSLFISLSPLPLRLPNHFDLLADP
ncbi:putative alpha-1,3-mannosyl-glycoprotein beta-1,2-N-acetylglucosaminyltransferase [Penaeus vannamei]|uniref:Putative alpha-1,3-mannosyl-glycoprotein beta-1,2-N-acetylglucosaminyltransferase n=1 Tax=Penaeus vannamei TaxID=6689 RepID=A0A3R7SL43_PENVA|nr:putative alpha-1,3-mannosyl-glycoprotein beta-1,2-N-acetylglucosaminyltransferase [Penaeus vannamei]